MKGPKPAPKNVIPMKGDGVGSVPDPFVWMTETAADIWDELAPHLHRLQRLPVHHRYQFASYCEAVASFVKATNEIEMGVGRNYEVKTRNGLQQKKTQAYLQQQEAMNQMRRDSALFGLSPVDEARLSEGGQGDFLADLMASLKGEKPSASA